MIFLLLEDGVSSANFHIMTDSTRMHAFVYTCKREWLAAPNFERLFFVEYFQFTPPTHLR